MSDTKLNVLEPEGVVSDTVSVLMGLRAERAADGIDSGPAWMTNRDCADIHPLEVSGDLKLLFAQIILQVVFSVSGDVST